MQYSDQFATIAITYEAVKAFVLQQGECTRLLPLIKSAILLCARTRTMTSKYRYISLEIRLL
jgi:hypothetical protein